MLILQIGISVFIFIEILNVIILYTNPTSKMGNGVGVFDSYNEIKEEVKKYLSEDLQLTNLDQVFQVIVKSAIFEFLYKPKISTKIIIKEYLDASNFFLEDGQTKYLNAILDKIAKKIRITNAWIWINKKLFSKTF